MMISSHILSLFLLYWDIALNLFQRGKSGQRRAPYHVMNGSLLKSKE